MKAFLFVIFTSLLLPTTRAGDTPMTPSPDHHPLPPPAFDSSYALERALLDRRSVRDFTDADLSLPDLAQLLWACQGISEVSPGRRGPRRARTAPSAGALYPLEVYVIADRVEDLEPGLYHYHPGPNREDHALERLQKGSLSPSLSEAALGQRAVAEAAANIVIAAVIERTAAKYGSRARRYVLMEVGHAAQNVCLQAESLDLGAVTIGAFSDREVRDLLGEDVDPFYILSIGAPRP